MKRFSTPSGLVGLLAILTLTLGATGALGLTAAPDSFHDDWRGTPRQQIEPNWNAPMGLSGEGLVRAFLADHGVAYQLAEGQADLQLAEVKESLLGLHYRFEQILEGVPVEFGEVIVSLSKADGHVYRAWNNYYPVPAGTSASILIDRETAYDLAWARLNARGDLLSAPSAKQLWQASAEGFRPIWRVDLELASPYGGWNLVIDAATGEVLELADARLYRLVDDFTSASPDERIGALSGPAGDRHTAFTRFESANQNEREAGTRADGTGVMFDPDPRATLMNDNLQDSSPSSYFTDAYFTRTLSDITFSGGLYRVTGPWVNIMNWDSPNTAPSTTVDGNWTATRGDNSFNDAMTYYMIDTNQRYMQGLGFTGATGIQEGSIGTDTDGANGADNSYYYSSTNRMSFGHGCVDDSEDSDVMLHEYGHAIQYSINSSWGGGHTGALGEGFGDYWAGSYSYDTPNGQTYHPEWVFSWDGHGTGNQCWGGRYLNRLNLQYNHNASYGAHAWIGGGYSDELWSTPLFQSLVALVDLGESRDDVDQIILESHFGIGYGPKMRDLANATVAAAQALQPGGPHAGVFITKFAHHGIIDDLTAIPEGDTPGLPDGIRLSQNSPNPFNPKTEIRFTLPVAGAVVDLTIFDVAGRALVTLVEGAQAGGEHVLNWNGRDEQDRPVGSGVYFYRLSVNDMSETKKMLLLK